MKRRKLTTGQQETLTRIDGSGGRWVAGMGSRMAEQFLDGNENELNSTQVRALMDRNLVRINRDGDNRRHGELIVISQPGT